MDEYFWPLMHDQFPDWTDEEIAEYVIHGVKPEDKEDEDAGA